MGPSRSSGNYLAATPENPSFNLNSPEAWDAFGSTRTATGTAITAEGALTWDAWYRGVSLLALYIAKTPLHVWKTERRATGDGRTASTDHPAYRLLRWQANEVQTAFQLQLALAGHAVNRGNGYAYIWRTGPDPMELTLLDPDCTRVAPDSAGKWYQTRIGTGPLGDSNGYEERKIPAADIFHVRGFGFDGFSGYPAFWMAKEAIGLGDAQQRHKAIRYKNSARPGVVLETPNKLVDKAANRLRDDWERLHSGLENSHRTAVLDNGLKASKLTFTAEEMQEVEQAGLSIRQAANFLGVPSSKLGDVAGIKYASKEQDDLAFLNDGLDFWFCSIEDEARAKLLLESEKESGDFAVEFDRSRVARGDSASRATYNRTALAGQPWKTQNEVRSDEGLEPHEDPEADKLRAPLNMGQGGDKNDPDNVADRGPGKPAKNEAAETVPAIDAGAVRDAAAAALADACRRVVKRIGSQAMRASKEPAKFMDWLQSFPAENAEATAGTLEPACKMLTALGLDSLDAELLHGQIAEQFDAVAGAATAKHLAAAIEGRCNAIETILPAWAVATFLPGEKP